MVKRIVMLAVLALALPLAAFANSVDLTNVGGTVTGGAGGLTLSNSVIMVYSGVSGSNLGSVSFTTGAFTTGNAQNGGTLAAGGSFTVIGNGNNGVPNGTIFSGSFSSATWSVTTLADGTHNYTLVAAIVDGSGHVGATSQLTLNTGTGLFNGSVGLASGDTSLSVPEPGTLSLFGTGLIGLAGVIRRKLNLV